MKKLCRAAVSTMRHVSVDDAPKPASNLVGDKGKTEIDAVAEFMLAVIGTP